MHTLIQLKRSTPLFLIALACFGLSPAARAVDPPPDGGYPNGNTAEGEDALFSLDTSSIGNTAIGFEALYSNTTGLYNTAIGYLALDANTNTNDNTAIGAFTLSNNTTGAENTANGSYALMSNTTGGANTATGRGALFWNTTGPNNTATGHFALFNNTIGDSNTAIGFHALANNTTGRSNTALGFQAGAHLTTGNNNIDIGNVGGAGESRTIRIGTKQTHRATFIAGIRDVTTGNGDAITVVIDSAGQLGTMSSSQRFKNEIKPMEQSSEAIFGLKPVTFHYKGDAKSTPQFGLIAEDVEKVNPDLIARDADGKPYTVRYEAVNAMLLNEFLKEHRTVQGQQKEIDALKAELKEQKALIQKVSAQIELSKPAPRTVLNNQ